MGIWRVEAGNIEDDGEMVPKTLYQCQGHEFTLAYEVYKQCSEFHYRILTFEDNGEIVLHWET